MLDAPWLVLQWINPLTETNEFWYAGGRPEPVFHPVSLNTARLSTFTPSFMQYGAAQRLLHSKWRYMEPATAPSHN